VIRPVLEAVARIGRPPVRVVSPVPPHDYEPYPDEPFAPAYDYVPLTGATTQVAGIWRELPGTKHLPDPYGPDPVVFGSVPRVGG
jgi:hypothetical protein